MSAAIVPDSCRHFCCGAPRCLFVCCGQLLYVMHGIVQKSYVLLFAVEGIVFGIVFEKWPLDELDERTYGA